MSNDVLKAVAANFARNAEGMVSNSCYIGAVCAPPAALEYITQMNREFDARNGQQIAHTVKSTETGLHR